MRLKKQITAWIGIILSAAAIVAFVPKPSTSTPVLAVAGDSVTATWVYKAPGFLAGDTTYVKWRQRKAADTAWTTLQTLKLTTALTKAGPKYIQAPAAGSFDSIQVQVWMVRPAAASPSPTASVKVRRNGPVVTPPGGVDSLQLLSLAGQIFVVDGNLVYTNQPRYNHATYTGADVKSCKVGTETVDALGRQTTGCKLLDGTTAYNYVNCVVAIRTFTNGDTLVSWAFPSNIVSECLQKAAPLVATAYGIRWRPDVVPMDSIAFSLAPATYDSTKAVDNYHSFTIAERTHP